MLEAKPLYGGPDEELYYLPPGQRITLQALARIPQFTVLVLYGSKNEPSAMQVFPSQARACSLEEVRVFVSDWFRKANEPR